MDYRRWAGWLLRQLPRVVLVGVSCLVVSNIGPIGSNCYTESESESYHVDYNNIVR